MSKSDYPKESGGSALGARLRRLSERIDRQATQCYALADVRFEQRWFGTLNQLRLNGPMSVSEIAAILGVTHVSVSQARKSLEQQNFVQSSPDPDDGRRSKLDLTAKGRRLIAELAPLWDALSAVSAELDAEAGVVEALDRLETALDRQSLFDRVQRRIGTSD